MLMLGAWVPFLIGLLVSGFAAGVCFYGWRETRLRGWRMLGSAFVVRFVASLPSALMRARLFDGFSDWVAGISLIDFVATALAGLLVIGGLYALVDEYKRLRGNG
jgi:hypothetical protein